MIRAPRFLLLLVGFTWVTTQPSYAGDWPCWRFNAARCGASPHDLPEDLQLLWTHELPAPEPAWPASQTKLNFDRSYAPVAAGKQLFVPSMVQDCVTAYDTESGREVWRFHAAGPVRFAPTVHAGRVYFVSDDGYLYCLTAEEGRLLWKFRGGPSDRRVLGNGRLISAWPARGAPVIYEDTVYFAAGIWPFMGIFLHALNAESGEVVWTNSGSGSMYLTQQHSSPAFAGVSPQGYLTACQDVLLVPGGRTVPAAFDRHTGEFLYFHAGSRSLGKGEGCTEATTVGPWFFAGGAAYHLANGETVGRCAGSLVLDREIIQTDGRRLSAGTIPEKPVRERYRDRKGKQQERIALKPQPRWRVELAEEVDSLHCRAGSRVYGVAKSGELIGVDLPTNPDETKASVSWRAKVPGELFAMLAADEKLFVVTLQGSIYCFGKATNTTDVKNHSLPEANDNAPQAATVETILRHSRSPSGYCIVYQAESADQLLALAENDSRWVIAVERDPSKARRLRNDLDARNAPREQVAVHEGTLESFELPPYLASLMILGEEDSSSLLDNRDLLAGAFRVLRPYGGVACLWLSVAQHEQLVERIERVKTKSQVLSGAEVVRAGNFSLLRRKGPLPDAGFWTHHHGDAGNTLVSREARVKLPMGLLWFGGPSNDHVLPRHGHGPTPQVVGGRVIIEGPDMLRATDVYSGRLLWERELPDLGLYFNNTGHHPGAGATGGNFVSQSDAIYVAYGRKCLKLDPATGKNLSIFELPKDEDGKPAYWGYIGVLDDLLIAGVSPLAPLTSSRWKGEGVRFAEGSRRLAVLDRHSGKLLWTRAAEFNFRHNAICAGRDTVFCLDRMTDARLALLKRRGEDAGKARLLALDARSGQLRWETQQGVFGTWLGFSTEHDVLLQAGSGYRDRARDEVRSGLVAYRGNSGKVLWESDASYGGPCLLHRDWIITQGAAHNLLTGKPRERTDPLTGETVPWKFYRNYGCNHAIGCENLLTFRSAAAGYFDLAGDGGTGNWGGFRSGCTANLIPADGVLSAPDYTRTCSCAYQLQCSLGLVHMPDVEVWTFNAQRWSGQRVQRVGINFSAPGDRRDKEGTLWTEYPSVGGLSPDLPIYVAGAEKRAARRFRYHPSRVASSHYNWVASSGLIDVRKVVLTLAREATKRNYTVRLVFAEPEEDCTAGERVFDVALQGQTEEKVDIVKQTGSAWRTMVRVYQHVAVAEKLTIDLTPHGSRPPVLCGISVAIEPE